MSSLKTLDQRLPEDNLSFYQKIFSLKNHLQKMEREYEIISIFNELLLRNPSETRIKVL